MFFANSKRQELRIKYPDLKITDIGKKLGELWKEQTPEEKRIYEDMHQRDLERYKRDMSKYTPPENNGDSDSDSGRKKRKKKDPNKPKRAMSSFMFFANQKRTEVRAAHPDLKITEIGKKLSELWKALTPEEKKKYEDMQANDKERYKREMSTYKPSFPELKQKDVESENERESSSNQGSDSDSED